MAVTFGEWINALEGGDEETEKVRQQLIGLQEEQVKVADTTNNTAKGNKELNPTLEETSKLIDSIQSAYKTMEDAIDQYNEKGYITLDTLQALLTLDDEYLAKLDLKNGKILDEVDVLNLEAEALKQSKLEALQAAFAKDVEAIATDNVNQQSALAQSAISNLGDKSESAGTQARNAAVDFWALASGIEAANNATAGKDINLSGKEDQINAVYNSYKNIAAKIGSIKVGGGVTGSGAKKSSGSKGSSSAKKEKEWWETELEKLKKQFDYSEISIDQYIGGLGSILGRLKTGSDEWRKINDELQKQRLNKIKDDYSQSKITIDEYIKSLENLRNQYKANTESYKDLDEEIKKAKLDKIKDDYNQSRITIDDYIKSLESLRNQYRANTQSYKDLDATIRKAKLDKAKDDYDSNRISLAKYITELKKLQKQYKENTAEWLELASTIKSSLIKQQEEFKSQYEQAYNAAEKLIDNEIDKVQELRDEQEKYYDDLIAAKQKANEETKDEIELARLQEQIEYARNNKSRIVWNEAKGVWEYKADEQAIKDAETDLNDFIFDQEIKELEETRDKELAILDEQIEGWEEYKEKWKSILTEYEDAQNYKMLIDKMGAKAEADILNQRLEVLKKFKDNYLSIQKEIGGLESMSTNDASKAAVKGSYANGGIIDFTGLAKVHGSSTKPEIAINNDQATKLFNYIQQMPKPTSNMQNNNMQNNNTNNNQKIFHINKIVLENVKGPEDFINELLTYVNTNS